METSPSSPSLVRRTLSSLLLLVAFFLRRLFNVFLRLPSTLAAVRDVLAATKYFCGHYDDVSSYSSSAMAKHDFRGCSRQSAQPKLDNNDDYVSDIILTDNGGDLHPQQDNIHVQCEVSLKQEFLTLHKEEYGYPPSTFYIEELRANDFPQLKGETYLDHAGATLYSRTQIGSHFETLCDNLYGNPHSQSGCSSISSNVVDNAREEVLRFFNARRGQYTCIFTSGATAALKLVGETFPWTSRSSFWYTMENHNSVLGMREYALAAGASAHAVDVEGADHQWDIRARAAQRRAMCSHDMEIEEGPVYNLFAFPSECNFSGRRIDLGLIKFLQEGNHTEDCHSHQGSSVSRNRCMVLIDAAKSCGTSQLDLALFSPDFVAISFYKIFGYPTGLGALLVRTDSARVLQKKYFGGGTVAASIADVDFYQKRESIEQWLEDGTVSFLAIAALQRGFSMVNKIGISKIGLHVGCLAKFTALQLSGLKHPNGNYACVLYGNHDSGCYWGDKSTQGPIVTFNLKRPDGTWIGYREVEKLASLNGIHLRTGCFCNPGACSKYLGLSEMEIRANFEAGHVCWDDHDVINEKPTGAIRVSFGYMSTIDDSLALLNFLKEFFLDKGASCLSASLYHPTIQEDSNLLRTDLSKMDSSILLESITIYPIKSCGGFTVDSWPLGDCGLLYDREWLVMSSTGVALTQKKSPMMCLIGTYIDRARNKLVVTSPNMKSRLHVPLTLSSCEAVDVGFSLCGERSTGLSYEQGVADWFTEALGMACSLVRRRLRSRQVRSRGESCDFEPCRELSYANEGQFLLVSRASVEDLNNRAISSSGQAQADGRSNPLPQVDVMRFRPNFVVSGGHAFEEDGWHSISIGDERFTVLGGCNRCQMINIDQATGRSQEGSNPLLTLASYRRIKGKILFGILLVRSPSEHHEQQQESTHMQRLIKVGSKVFAQLESSAL